MKYGLGVIGRRDFVKAGVAVGMSARMPSVFAAPPPKREFHVFTKNFTFLTREQLCEVMAEVGMDGLEWCVRGGGHVEPLKVKTEFPLAVKAAEKFGLKSTMICTRSKCDGTDAAAEGDIVETLKVCADYGIRTWRPGGFVYDKKLSVADNLKVMTARFRRLEEISRLSGVKCTYQNHFGCFGGGVYDMLGIVRQRDPRYFAIQYDVLHGVFETPVSWERHLKDAAPFIASACLKDCNRLADQKADMWKTFKTVPSPTGIIPFERYAKFMDEIGLVVPHSVHYEFPLPKDDRKALLCEVRRELDYFKGVFLRGGDSRKPDNTGYVKSPAG